MSYRRDKMVSGGKEKIFDGNGDEMWVAEKKVKEKKKKKEASGIHVHHVMKFTN